VAFSYTTRLDAAPQLARPPGPDRAEIAPAVEDDLPGIVEIIYTAANSIANLGYASSQRYRDHEAFSETIKVSIALHISCQARVLVPRSTASCSAALPRAVSCRPLAHSHAQ
jgi:hypothetical protein